MRVLLCAICIFVLASCATHPDIITGSYVSPQKYQGYSCSQICTEMEHVNECVLDLHDRLAKEVNADAWQMGASAVLFWPAAFFLEGGDGPEATEYASLQGEYEALRTVAVDKGCELSKPDSVKGK